MREKTFYEKVIEYSSVSLPDGRGDTHIHPFGKKETDVVVTTRVPLGDNLGSLVFHDKESGRGWKHEYKHEPPASGA